MSESEPTTTDTTAANRQRSKRLMRRLFIASIVVHVLLIVALGPMIYTRMTLDREEAAQQSEQAKLRNAERRLAEQQKRERMELSKLQARKLKAEQERRHQRELRQRVDQLERIAQEMDKVRKQRLDKLAKRSEKDIVLARTENLRSIIADVEHKMKDIKGYKLKHNQAKDRLDEQAKELRDQLDAIVKNPDDYKTDAKKLADLAERHIGELTDEQEREPDGGQRYRMNKVKKALGELADDAGKLAAGVDPKGENTVPGDAVAGTDSNSDSTPKAGPNASAGELYDTAVAIEKKIQSDFNDARAADNASSSGRSFADARKNAGTAPPDRPDLGKQLGDPPPNTVGDFDRYRKALGAADRETADIRTRSVGMLAQAGGDTSAFGPSGQAAQTTPVAGRTGGQRGMVIARAARGQQGRVINMTGVLGGTGGTEGFGQDLDGLRMADDDSGIRDPIEAARLLVGPELRVNSDRVQRNALPGRAFTEASERKGWLFLDTWYVIGPWENDGRLRHERTHPPEQAIDFDAVYTDGKFADKPNHPANAMRWEFYQSDQIRCQPPRVYNDATYYAYTEVYSDRDREVLLTVSTDDAAKAWLNGQVVWEDVGLSPWKLGEGFRRVPLRKGFNTVLVRIENGPTHCVWSVLMCPTELLDDESK